MDKMFTICINGDNELDEVQLMKKNYFSRSIVLRTLSTDNEETEKETRTKKKDSKDGDDMLKEVVEGEEEEEDDIDARADIIGSMLKQYYFINGRINLWSLVYMVLKFEIFNGQTLILCKDIDAMYRMKMFLERAQLTKVQTYNLESPLSIRVHHMA